MEISVKYSIYLDIYKDGDWVMNIYENGKKNAKGYSGKEKIIDEIKKL